MASGIIDSLLTHTAGLTRDGEDNIDHLIKIGGLDAPNTMDNHLPCVEEHSDARLICFAAGYAAPKKILTTKSDNCKTLCLLQQSEVSETLLAAATKEWGMGGLLCPSEQLCKLIFTLQNQLMQVFSTCQLHAGFMVDTVSLLGGLPRTGCPDHSEIITKDVT